MDIGNNNSSKNKVIYCNKNNVFISCNINENSTYKRFTNTYCFQKQLFSGYFNKNRYTFDDSFVFTYKDIISKSKPKIRLCDYLEFIETNHDNLILEFDMIKLPISLCAMHLIIIGFELEFIHSSDNNCLNKSLNKKLYDDTLKLLEKFLEDNQYTESKKITKNFSNTYSIRLDDAKFWHESMYNINK